jgi:hypothetical protein
MATSDQILDAATRQSAGEELSGADRTMANMVNNAANPELPQEIKEGWAQMSLEDRSMALGSLIDEKKGGTTAPAQTAPESNTGPSVTLPVERTKEERDTYASTGWETGLEADPNDEWLVPEMPTLDLGYSDKTKNQKLSMAAIIKAGETGRPLPEILYEMNTDGSKDRSQETLQDAGSSYQISEQEVAKDIANRQLMGEMEDPEEMADTVEATNRYVQARIEDQAATYKSFIMSMGIEEDAEDVIETLQGNAALYNVVMEAADEVGLGDQVWDIGRSFVLGSLKDNMMLSGLSGVVGSEDYLMSLKAKLDNTDPKDREAVFRVMNEELKEILPDVQRLRVLQTLAGTTPEQDAADNFGPLDPLMDAGEVALYATGVGLGAYGTYKGVKALKKLGSSADDVADTIALGVAAREKAAKSAIGMDDEAVNSTLDPPRS